MTFLVLVLALAVTDGAFAGYRDGAGFDGRIGKRRYYQVATARGAVYGVAWVSVALAAALALAGSAPDPEAVWRAYALAARPMVYVYLSYAALVGSAFVPYFFGGIELRNLASVTVFGPLTLIRKAIMFAGAGLGIWATSEPRAWIAVGVGFLGGLLSGPLLRRWRLARPLP